MNDMVSALYVETNGCYFGLPDVDPWDVQRDARRFRGPGPVVAHPPCERWGRYSEGGPSHHGRFRTGDDGGCFHAALAAVLEHGGVLEHPEASKAWDAYGIVKPPRTGGWVRQGDQVWTCCVYQAQYGHLAPKATWLLYSSPSGIEPPELRWGFKESALPPSGSEKLRTRGARTANDAIERMGKRQRQATPPPFRDLLLGLARHSVGGAAEGHRIRRNGQTGHVPMSLLNRMRNALGPQAGDVEAVRTALRHLSPDDLGRLQAELHAEDDRVEQDYAHCMVLYHGAPARTANQIRREGFRLTPGRRSGFLGSERVVENLAVFLAEERKVAAVFGANRADFDGAEVLEVRADIRQMLDMTSWARVPRALRELGERLVQEYDGAKAPKAPTQADMFWLIDQPAFVAAVRAQGYDAARFKEAAGTMRSLGLGRKGEVTVAVFDPQRLYLAPPPRGSLGSLMRHLQQREPRRNGRTNMGHVQYVHQEDEDAERTLEAIETLFHAGGIQLHSNYDRFLFVQEEDIVVAAIALCIYDYEDPDFVEFSVAVAPDRQRRGYARTLLREAIEHARQMAREFYWDDDAEIEAYVVNPTAMVPLLSAEGFQQDSTDRHVWRRLLSPRSNGAGTDAAGALIVVHPSSIEAYIDTLRSDGCDVALGEELLFNIALTVQGHKGPVIWIDQGWDGRHIGLLRREVAGVAKHEIHFDEAEEPWARLWPKLRRALRSVGATRALVAGLWWGENSGCAKNVFDWLQRQGMAVEPVEDALGYEGDCEPMEDDTDERPNGRARWGSRGAGALFYSLETKRILLGLRSKHVMEPGTWGGFGGKIDDDDVDPLDAMLREVSEETEYNAEDMLAAELLWVYEKPDFRYYNYLVVVREEFDPVLNWENETAEWFDPRHLPKPLHYGLKALLPHLRAHLGL